MRISSTPMQLKEGVLANNDILSFEEFSEFMTEQLQEEVIVKLLARLNMIASHIRSQRYKKAYTMWENLERDIFLNKDYHVSLLLIENIAGVSGQYTLRYASKEQAVLSERGKLTRLKALSEQLMKQSVEEQLVDHLAQFIDDVATKRLPYKYIQQVFAIGDSETKSNAANARWRTHDWTYKNILYGNNPVWQGNVADAFMNHVAHLHVELMANNLNEEDKALFTQSVFNEERNNIFDLLYASKNNTAWFTGGDIIFKYNNQIYNIQLKTTQGALKSGSRIGGKLATHNLLTLIDELKKELMTRDLSAVITTLYNNLKTSGWVEAANTAIAHEADAIVEAIKN